MNTKRTIFRIKHELNECLNDGVTKDNLFEAIDNMQAQIKEGKKYKVICEELEKYYGLVLYYKMGVHNVYLQDVTKTIKQKYLPKEEAVLILDIKGEKELVDWWVDRIKKFFEKEEHIDVNEGTRGEEE